MSFVPQLATSLLPALTSAAPAIVGGLTSALISKTPNISIPPAPEIRIPEPTEPPKAPLTPSQTAALQRARRSGPVGSGITKLSLSQGTRQRDETAPLIQRKTLLGR